MMEAVDVVVFAPHPDDGEGYVGGTLIRLKQLGYRTAIVDMNRGECGTQYDVEERTREAERASEILGLDVRLNLDLGDAHMQVTNENVSAVVQSIRRLKPRLVLAPATGDFHPDHRVTAELVDRAFVLARLPRYEPELPAHSPELLLQYIMWKYSEQKPTFVMDVTDVFEQKLEAIKVYASQFEHPDRPEGYRFIGTSDHFFHNESRARFFGLLIDRHYGEPFIAPRPLLLDDPFRFLEQPEGDK